MLRAVELSARYGDVQVLHGVCLEVGQGEVISLIGANGAGKTTFLSVLSGLLRPSGGEAYFLGQRLNDLAPHDIVELGLVHVPEGRQVFPGLSVLENLELGAYPSQARRRLGESLARVWRLFPLLRERRRQRAGSLSGGEQQMLAISRGLVACPRLLLLDEPSLGLAPLIVKEIFRTIGEIKAAGTPLLLVEQNAFYSLTASDRGYALENGRVALSGQATALLQDPHVKSAYLGV
jgi:branched-chain amino acid transport system ATP-binding protein